MDVETPQDSTATTDSAVVEEVKEEGQWAKAEEAFDKMVSEDSQPKKEETKEQEKPEGSQLESEASDYLKSLETVKVPHKYKPLVEEWAKKTVSEIEGKQKAAVEATQKDLGETQKAVKIFVDIFRDIAQNPNKIADYVDQYGEHIGLDPSLKEKLRAKPQQTPQDAQQPKRISVEDIGKKYAQSLANAKDENEFVGLLNMQNNEVLGVYQQEILGKVAQLFKVYHDKYIAPDKTVLNEFKTKAESDAFVSEVNTKKASWNSAAAKLEGKYEDFKKYKPDIAKIVKAKRSLLVARNDLNSVADDVDGRVEFLENVYLLVSRNDHLNKKKLPSGGGLPPSQRHINTTNSGGGNWKDAEQAFIDYPE